ncbi:hypothetical protein A2U01_0077793, partial [Trifolium medium]|nr:hypothetical protein [Trifolium medium]
AKREEVSKSS